jgi:ribosomal protein L7/L12
MENLGTYFLIALAIGWIIYYSKKKKTSTPKAKASAKPRVAAASKPSTKKPATKKGGQTPKKGAGEIELLGGIGNTSSKPPQSSAPLEVSDFDLLQATQQKMKEGNKLEAVKFVMNRTGWGLKKAKDYCDKLEEQNRAAKKGEKATVASTGLSSDLGTSKGKQSGSTSSLSDFDLMAELSLDSMGKGDSKSLSPSNAPSAPSPHPNFDLETEVKQLQARTGWDYAKAKAYCEQALEYHKKIATPARLKKSN